MALRTREQIKDWLKQNREKKQKQLTNEKNRIKKQKEEDRIRKRKHQQWLNRLKKEEEKKTIFLHSTDMQSESYACGLELYKKVSRLKQEKRVEQDSIHLAKKTQGCGDNKYVERFPSDENVYNTREEIMEAEKRNEGKINWDKFNQLVEKTKIEIKNMLK